MPPRLAHGSYNRTVHLKIHPLELTIEANARLYKRLLFCATTRLNPRLIIRFEIFCLTGSKSRKLHSNYKRSTTNGREDGVFRPSSRGMSVHEGDTRVEEEDDHALIPFLGDEREGCRQEIVRNLTTRCDNGKCATWQRTIFRAILSL